MLSVLNLKLQQKAVFEHTLSAVLSDMIGVDSLATSMLYMSGSLQGLWDMGHMSFVWLMVKKESSVHDELGVSRSICRVLILIAIWQALRAGCIWWHYGDRPLWLRWWSSFMRGAPQTVSHTISRQVKVPFIVQNLLYVQNTNPRQRHTDTQTGTHARAHTLRVVTTGLICGLKLKWFTNGHLTTRQPYTCYIMALMDPFTLQMNNPRHILPIRLNTDTLLLTGSQCSTKRSTRMHTFFVHFSGQ